MEQFNHKIFKIKKELTDITYDLNKFKTKNHKTITKIIDNLNIIPNKLKSQTINNNTGENDIKLNNHKKNICYTKKSVSLEKNNLHPYKEPKNNLDIISLSANNLNVKDKEKRAISSYFNKTNKNKICVKTDNTLNNMILEDIKNKKNVNNSKNNIKNHSIVMINNYENKNNEFQKLRNYNKYMTLDDKYFNDKENNNVISNYNNEKDKKNSIINIYSYNHNYKNRFNYKLLYNKNLINTENEKNDLNLNKNCITLQNKHLIEPKIEIIDINTNGYNNHIKRNNNLNKGHPFINLSNISQKIRADNNIFKTVGNKNSNNTQKINSFREKLLNGRNKKENTNSNSNDINFDIIKENKNNKIELIYKYLNVNNFEEAKIKINYLKKYEKFYKQLEKNYCKYNNKQTKKYNFSDILFWIFNISNNNSKINYKSFLENIMKKHNIESLEQLKSYTNN